MAALRASGCGGTHQWPGPAVAVTPLVPQKPLSTRITRLPSRAAATAAQVPASPPPMISTSAVRSSTAEDVEWAVMQVRLQAKGRIGYLRLEKGSVWY